MATFEYNAYWYYQNGTIVGSAANISGTLDDGQPGDGFFTPSDSITAPTLQTNGDGLNSTYKGTIELTNVPQFAGVTWVGVEQQNGIVAYYAMVPDGTTSSDINNAWRTQFGSTHTESTVEPSLQNTTEFVTCFVAGTLILTERGEVRVETLRAGDLVVSAATGTLKPVRWMGHSYIDLARHPNGHAVAPILIRAGALAEGVPHRDLRVSPAHALYLDGHLVPARLLVNGESITQELWRGEVTYWHVELETHGLLVSDGAISESYFDDGNRASFDNFSVARMIKDFESERGNGRYAEAACRPLMQEGPALTALRMRIAGRLAPAAATRSRAA